MAILERKRPENVEGDFFVDDSCIDCGTCYWMAPSVFHETGGMSYVHRQPEPAERLRAAQALIACPTASIGTSKKIGETKEAAASFPVLVAENVFHCGYHSESSFGAASFFIERPGGNVLVDSPRFTPLLVKAIEARGGVRYLFLTHKDDVADHAKFREHFHCERILHTDDVTRGTADVEIRIKGDALHHLADDLKILPVPGHTRGHCVLLAGGKFLFTGDHLAAAEPGSEDLIAFRNACWYSWEKQIESMKRCLGLSFEWVLPGHGNPMHAPAVEMRRRLEKCVEWMASAA